MTLFHEEVEANKQFMEMEARYLSSIAPMMFMSVPDAHTDTDIRKVLAILADMPAVKDVEWQMGKRSLSVSSSGHARHHPDWFARLVALDNPHEVIRLKGDEHSHGILNVTLDPAGRIELSWQRIRAQVVTVLAVVAILFIAIFFILRSSLKGLDSLRKTAERFGMKDYAARAVPAGSADVRLVVHEFNRMADTVDREIQVRLQTENMLRQRQTMLENVLNALDEIVLSLDAHGQILLTNPAATVLVDASVTLPGHQVADVVPLLDAENQRFDWKLLLQEVQCTGHVAIDGLCLKSGKGMTFFEGSATWVFQHGQANVLVVLRDISELKRMLGDAEWKASHDPLTGLPNRLLLADRLGQACAAADRQASMVAVSLLDLDGFKHINDTHGHDFGDLLLCECSRRLEASLRGMDTVVRLGGDEFVVLLTSLASKEQAQGGVERILAIVSEPYRISGQIATMKASLGLTIYPEDRADPDTLLRHADHAMYLAKGAGTGLWRAYEKTDESGNSVSLTRLATALETRELELFYQPQVNMRIGRVVGFEALLRWRHPERGLLGPGDFLPEAERTPLIDAIGDWVMIEALLALECWHARGRSFSIAVNIAGRHFLSPGFVPRLKELLANHPDLPPFSLRLEITESSALADMAFAAAVVSECRILKVGVAVDDFGTGYASLAYLRQLPVDELKIDQNFVRDILDDRGDMALVEAVISLSAVFERQVLAEGVETAEHGVLLMRLGCDLAQGYGIARPMPAGELENWLDCWQPDASWALWTDVIWDIKDFPLIVAQYDHVRWVRQIHSYLQGSGFALEPEELADHHSCRFGHWYGSQGRERYGQMAEFSAIESIHQEVHRLGNSIVTLVDLGEIPQAELHYKQLVSLRDHILDLLQKLQTAVVRVS